MRNRQHLWLLRILCVSIVYFFQLSVCNPASAQGSAFVAKEQSRTLLPGSVKNVSVINGDLYCCASGVLMKARRSGEQVLDFSVDTDFAKREEGIEYVVQHPVSGDIYFTRRDKHGDSWLYISTNYGRQNEKTKMLRIGGGLLNKGMTVEHPTFSKDGNVMIFSSSEKQGSNSDLWYVYYDGSNWSKPQKMGNRLNTRGDEISPMFYGDYLVFSTNGQKEDSGYFALYSTRMRMECKKESSSSDQADGAMTWKVSGGAVQRMPYPINVPSADNFDMAFDTRTECGYWVSRRNSPNADSLLFSLSGRLEGIMLWGRVTDKGNRPLAGVNVTARQGKGCACVSTTDANGHYQMYLQSNCFYDLSYKLGGFFTDMESINTTRTDGEYLMAEVQRNVTLDKLPLGQRILFEDIYGPGVDVELSERGIELLSPLVKFLNDNPSMLVEMTLVNDLSDDRTFNSLLTDQRILSLQSYLFPLLPLTVKISISNGCDGAEGCEGATGVSRLTVLIYNDL